MKKVAFALLFLFSAAFSLASCGGKKSYTVTWKNYDGAILEIDENVAQGSVPKYDGATPSRPADAQFTYTFSGWDKDISKGIEDNTTFTAQYVSVKNDYIVTFDGKGGTLVSGTEVQKVKYPNEIVPPVYEREDYVFTGWDKDLTTITTSTTVYAQWEYSPSDDTSLEIDGFTKEGNKLSNKTNNDIKTFSFSDIVHVAKGTTWKLYSDIRGQEEIITKTIDLNIGDNTVYINVTARSGRNELYTIVVRRLDIFTITWVNDDEAPLDTTRVQEDDMPEYKGEIPTKEPTAQYTYTFAGWVPSIVKASGNTTYKASYSHTTNEYTVTWKNYDGTVLETDESVPYGTIPKYDGETPTKPKDAQYTYNFKGWDKDIKKGIEGDTVFTAQFSNTVNTYTITWKNYDGSTLSSEDYDYGATPSYKGETPTKPADAQYTYTFAGWSPTIVAVTGAATYTATYTNTTNRYTITWKNYDGSTISSEDYDYGATPSYKGETPTKPSTAEETFTFTGWTPVIVEVTGAATYTATFSSSVTKHTISWYSGTKLLHSEELEYGSTPTYHWEDKPTKAETDRKRYDWEGEWEETITTVTGPASYHAKFDEVNKYLITYVNWDGTELQKSYVASDNMPSYTGETPTKDADAQYTYSFEGWDKDEEYPTCDTTYTAVYSKKTNKYTVTWKNYDGTVLETDKDVEYGTIPSYDGEIPTKPKDAQYTYTFSGWGEDVGKGIVGDTTFIAQYSNEINKYTITWKNDDGTVLETDKDVEYGTVPSYDGATPTKPADAQYTYTFSGWDKDITKGIEGDTTFTAQYSSTTNEYTITWKNYNGDVLETDENVPYGTMPSYDGETPTKSPTAGETFTFSGWSPTVVAVTGETTYIATYTSDIREYKITWKGGINGDELLKEEMVAYGSIPIAPTNVPSTLTDDVYEYTFLNKWSPVVTKVTGEATYVAQYSQKLRNFDITWKNWDGTPLHSDSVTYGVTPSYSGETPTKSINGHVFEWIGWDKEILPATQDITYQAIFDNDIIFDFVGTNCVINGKDEFTDVYTFGELNSIEYVIKSVNTYALPDTINVYIDDNLVSSDKYTYNKITGVFSIASNLGNIRLEVTGVRI